MLLTYTPHTQIVRGQDTRKRMETEGFMRPTLRVEKLHAKEAVTITQRPYLSFGAGTFMYIGTISILIPLCSVLSDIGLPSGMSFWPCWMVVLFGALFFSVCFSLFIVGIIVSAVFCLSVPQPCWVVVLFEALLFSVCFSWFMSESL